MGYDGDSDDVLYPNIFSDLMMFSKKTISCHYSIFAIFSNYLVKIKFDLNFGIFFWFFDLKLNQKLMTKLTNSCQTA